MSGLRTVAAGLAAGLAATALAAAPAQAAPAGGPMLLVPAVKAVPSGEPTWVQAYWGTTRDICDAKVTVRVANTELLYPTNTVEYTSFYRGDTLVAGAADYTAFRVTTTAAYTLLRAMHLTIAYRAAAGGACTGPVLTRTYYATLPVLKG
jgi:hypothetical protein